MTNISSFPITRSDAELGSLVTLPTASGIIPFLDVVDIVSVTDLYCHHLRDENKAIVRFGASHPEFPNSRGSISYEFQPRLVISIAGGLSVYTALKSLFFVAHGIGHSQQNNCSAVRRRFDLLIHPASSFSGSHQMDDLIEIDSGFHRFGTIFLELESEATRLGWISFATFAQESMSHEQLLELGFWYSLYGLVDHLYHRQSIEGPFTADLGCWLKSFGSKIDCILLPYVLTSMPGNDLEESWQCAVVGSDGWYHWLRGERLKGIRLFRRMFLDGLVDPFGVHSAFKNVVVR